MADNKWTRPDAPPPPLFTGEKEADFVKQINDEVIERIVGQQVLYFPISREHTNYHPLYGEAIEKTYWFTVKVVRTSGGAFNFNVRSGAGTLLKALSQNEWAEFAYNGTVYELIQTGTL